jgi:regulatory protein
MQRLPADLGKQFHFSFRALYFVTSLLHASLVFIKSRKVDTEQELYDIAIRALTRRSHSVSEMKKLLLRRADSELLAQVVMARLKEGGKLDDARYAKQFVRQRTEIRRQGAYRIARELRARGVPDRHIDAALKSAASENAGTPSDEASLLRQRIQRKLKLLRGPNSTEKVDDKKIASLYRSLLRAGFSADAVRRQLKSLASAELADGDSPESD